MAAPVLILGATGGVGEALARRLAAGRTPTFLAARSEARVAALAAQLEVPYAVCDVLQPDSIENAVAQAAVSGELAGLAYCVGSIVLKPIKAANEDDFLQAFRLNVSGAAMAIKAAQPALQRAGGSIVLFSTVAVAQGFTNHAVISAAKGDVEGLVRAAAAELAPKIRVNAVAPSLTRTPLAKDITRNDAMAKAIAQLHALPRLGEAEDVAAAAQFLLGSDSSWITGQVIPVDGGRSRIRPKG